MDETTRRRLLGSAGTAALAGLAGCGGVTRNLPFMGSNHEDPAADGKQIVLDITEDVKPVPVGGHAAWDFSADQYMEIDVEATVDGSYDIDFIITNAEGYQNYTAGEDFQYIGEESELGAERFSSNFQTGPGHYYVIVDNTSVGSAAPPDNADELDAPEASMTLEVFT